LKLVSVIIPTYQRVKFIEEAIRSVLNQTYGNLELIVIDDGSTDGTDELLSAISAEDQRVRYSRQANAGPAAARNKGVQISNGFLIAFLDSDDTWMPDKLEKQMRVFDQDVEVCFSYCSGFFVNENGERARSFDQQWNSTRFYSAEDFLFHRVGFFFTSSAVVKKECLEKVGAFDENLEFLEDVDLWFRILVECKSDYIDEPLVINRRHPDNLYLTKGRGAELQFARSNFQVSQKAVDLYERRVRRLSKTEKEEALYRFQLMFIKEALAHGEIKEARNSLRSYLRSHPAFLAALPYFGLSILPRKAVTWLVEKRKKRKRSS
jgi:glycosyltransferase involved in cell wall biosynthesis